MIRLQGDPPPKAFEIAAAAYPVREPLKRAIIEFQSDPDYRDRCYQALSIQQLDQIIDGLDLLALDIGLPKTNRTQREETEQM